MENMISNESIFTPSEAIGAVKVIALALVSKSEMDDDECVAAGKILMEAHFTFVANQLEQVEKQKEG